MRFPGFVGNENSSYKKHFFKDIFLFSTGKNIKQNEASPAFETPCVRYGELYHMYNEVISEVINKTNLNKSELTFSKGDEILLPSAGEDPLDIGSASALTIGNIAIGRTINILRPIMANVYSSIYVSYYINQKLRKKISTLAKGVSISNVYNSDLKTLEIILPSLSEQEKISDFLSLINHRIQTQNKIIEQLETLIKGLSEKLFSQKVRFKEFTDEWELKSLGEIGETFNGLSGKNKDNFGKGKPYIQYKQIFDSSRVQLENCGLVEISKSENQNSVRYGDVFFTISSETSNEIGMSSVLLDKVSEVYLNSFCFGYRVLSFQILHPLFSSYLFRSSIFRNKIVKLAQGSTRYNMSKVELMKLTISLPCEKEQTSISQFLFSIDSKIQTEKNTLEKYHSQKEYLLQNLFI